MYFSKCIKTENIRVRKILCMYMNFTCLYHLMFELLCNETALCIVAR
jgi:hypothetical protein